MSIQIRPVTDDDDLGTELALGTRAFGPSNPADRQMRLDRIAAGVAEGRFLGAFDGDQLIASAVYHDMRQWWSGRALPMAGVASVKVAPEHAGRGVGRAIVSELVGLAVSRGYPLSTLYPATAGLYRSLGWEIAGAYYQMTVPARTLRSLSQADAMLSGSAGASAGPAGQGSTGPGSTGLGSTGPPPLRTPGPADVSEVIEVISRVHEASRDCGPAIIEGRISRELAGETVFRCLAPDGYLAYQWGADGTEITVHRLIAGSAATTRALWAVVAGHATIARTVRASASPADPLPWLVREPDVRTQCSYPWMLRVLNVTTAIEGRGFPPAVTLTAGLQLADPQVPGNAGSWLLAIEDGKATMLPGEPAGGPDGGGKHGPALRLGPRGFAAMYGGVPLCSLRRAGLAAGGDPAADALLDSAFAATPYQLDEF